MPAAVVKGIIVSISIIAALGIAVLENPQVQVWLEEQRKKIAELLGSIGHELDPQTRRTAEAFAYEGKTPANDAGLQRELSGSNHAAALATGRSLPNASSPTRRIPVTGPIPPQEAEERKRKGKEYLAEREKQMLELQRRRKAAKAEGADTPPTPTFDSFVDDDGKLRADTGDLPSPPVMEPLSAAVKQDMKEVERQLEQPMAEASSSSMSAFQMGSRMADPFDDEYALDRSMTPKPPVVPPKVAFDVTEHEVSDIPRAMSPPASTQPHNSQDESEDDELSYEEQLAIAISLSEAESEAKATATRRQNDDDSELSAAIAASLKDMDLHRSTGNDSGAATPKQNDQPLVDLTSSDIPAPSPKRNTRSEWEALFNEDYAPSREPLSAVEPSIASEDTDGLYSITPQLTSARLATFDRQQAPPSSSASSMPYDPVRDAAARQSQSPQPAMDASFYSAPSSAAAPLRESQELVDVSEGAPSVDNHSSVGFHTESDSETFASASGPASQAQSRAESVISGPQMVEAVDDSDDVLSEDDGILTPDSWTEVGSHDGNESEDGVEHRPEVSA